MKNLVLSVSLFVSLATAGCASAQSTPDQMVYGRFAPRMAAQTAEACTVKSAPRTVGQQLPSGCGKSAAMATGRGAYFASTEVGGRLLSSARASAHE